MLKKIISGGQTGADQAGLYAAEDYGLETGGFAPKGWRTLDGSNPETLRDRFHLEEHPSWKYAPRTYANAKAADATIRLAIDFNSAGEKCTMKAIEAAKTPHIDVNLEDPCAPSRIAQWIVANNIETLNVAGNGQRESFDVFTAVREFLGEVFQELGLSHTKDAEKKIPSRKILSL